MSDTEREESAMELTEPSSEPAEGSAEPSSQQPELSAGPASQSPEGSSKLLLPPDDGSIKQAKDLESMAPLNLDDENDEEKGGEEGKQRGPKDEILWAAKKNEVETVRKLLEEDPGLISATDCDMYTPLHRACYSNHSEVIKVLLSYGACVSAKTVDGWQPLHCACQWDNVEAASLLLHNGADVNAITNGKLTPLHLASSNASSRRTLELLLWNPYLKPDIESEAKDTPYDTARRSGPFIGLFEILDESINVY